MDEHTTQELLAKVPLFKGLDKKHLDQIARLATRLDLPEGKQLTREGASGQEFVIVLEGEVEVRHGDEVIATMGAGDFVGEIALLTDRPRTATVVTKTPVKIEVIGRRDFLDMLDQAPDVAAQLESVMKARLAELDAG